MDLDQFIDRNLVDNPAGTIYGPSGWVQVLYVPASLLFILAIMGITALFGVVPVPREFLMFDLWVMLGASLLLAPFVFSKHLELTRRWGTLLTGLYIVYVVIVVMNG